MARKRIIIDMDADESGLRAAIGETAEVLRNGGVVVFPTETVYGIGVAAGHADALARLRRLKRRDAAKPFQFLAADMAMAERTGAVFPARARRLANAFWPGPLTLVVPDGTGSESTLGIRVPDSLFVHGLCRELGGMLVSSSANPAGDPPPLDADAADRFGDEADLLVDGGRVIGGVPSTVVRCSDIDYEILRQGGIDEDAIDEAWEN